MRAQSRRRGRRIRRVDILAGFVALLTLGTLIVTPVLVAEAVRSLRSHQVAAAKSRERHVGDHVRDGPVGFTVLGVQCGLQAVGGRSPRHGQFCEVRVRMHNGGVNPVTLAVPAQRAIGSKGAFYLPDNAANAAVNAMNPAVATGASLDSELVYDVPDGIRLVGIDLHGSEYSQGTTVHL